LYFGVLFHSFLWTHIYFSVFLATYARNSEIKNFVFNLDYVAYTYYVNKTTEVKELERVIGHFFDLPTPSSRIMALGLTLPLTYTTSTRHF
jgi:hypothetical protein